MEVVTTKTVVQLICEHDLQNTVSTDLEFNDRVSCHAICRFQIFFGIMSQPGSPERPPPDAEAMESSPGD